MSGPKRLEKGRHRGALSSFLALTFFALVVSGCAHKTTVSITSSAPAAIPPDPVYAVAVSPGSLAQVTKRVAASHISPADKAAFEAMVLQHRAKPQALDGKSVGEMINEERAYTVALQMVSQARQRESARRDAMARIVDVRVTNHRDEPLRTTLTFAVQNKTAKAIEGIELGMLVYDARGVRVGMGYPDLEHGVGPHGAQTFEIPVSYLKFGEDAGAMRLAAGKPKTISLQIKVVKYKDGTESGSEE